jgi:ABC-type glycerol-3-phosphate transport system substrate-binding protein
MGSRRSRSGKLVAATLAGAFALAACGGGESIDSSSDAASELPAVQVADVLAVEPSADLASNLLPDLVVDNLNDDNKVNLRNYGVGDKPILIWMWAPH